MHQLSSMPRHIIALMGLVIVSSCAQVDDELIPEANADTSNKTEDASTCPVMDQVLAERSPAEYPQELNEAIAAITLKTDTTPVGSYKFREQKFPGDIDMFETSEVALPKEEAKKFFSQRLSNLAQRVRLDKDLTLSDFKAGEDMRFKIDVGKFDETGLMGYDGVAIKANIQKLKDEGLLSEEEATNLNKLVKDNPSEEEWGELKEGLRQYYTLRWTIDELINQEKTLRGDKKMSLGDALEGSFVKIDVFAPVTKTEGYTEVTTIFNLYYQEDGKSVQLTQKLADYRDSITKDVLIYFAKGHRNHLKGAKRLWLLSTLLKDNEVTAKIIPLMQSSAAALNQVVSESEVVRGLLGNMQTINCGVVSSRLTNQIASFEKRILNNTLAIPVDLLSNRDVGLLKTSLDAFDKDCGTQGEDSDGAAELSQETKDLTIKNLTKLEDLIKPVVDDIAKDFLMQIKLNPDRPMDFLTGRVDVCPMEPKEQP